MRCFSPIAFAFAQLSRIRSADTQQAGPTQRIDPAFRYEKHLASSRVLVLRSLRGVLNNHGNNHGLAAQTARNPGTDGAAHNLLQLLRCVPSRVRGAEHPPERR